MNVKKMTCDELREEAEKLNAEGWLLQANNAEVEFASACAKELMKRWGIKG